MQTLSRRIGRMHRYLAMLIAGAVLIVACMTVLPVPATATMTETAATATGLAPPPAERTAMETAVARRETVTSSDWPQVGRDPQRTNYSPLQVDPPYCYTWKWYEAPIASRAQPVVASGRLFIGSMDGVMYARSASTGAPLWSFHAGSPIRHSAGVSNGIVVFSAHDGTTYALNATSGALNWKTLTGPSLTAPLMDEARDRVYVASSNGALTALNLSDGALAWRYESGAPILTSPALSADGNTIFLGNEAIYAIAVSAADGTERWRTRLEGHSLADRYPVVTSDVVLYRSQPGYFFHRLLHEGDAVMNEAGSVMSNWATDWSLVKPRIVNYLTSKPSTQTFFVLDVDDGSSRGMAPMLYTYGNNDIPNVPVIRNGSAYVTYRARHGIQTDGGAVHVSSQYDAELGQMNLSTLDITGLKQADYPQFRLEFRMTSDEPAMLSMSGNILWVDNWERLGGINVSTGQLIHVGGVSNDWPECYAQCGPGTHNPYFPLSGSGPAYPFPSPRVNEGHQRGGLVIANDMLYWRVIEGGLAGISHRPGSTCPAPLVYTQTPASRQAPDTALTSPASIPQLSTADASRPLADYVTLDLTTPAVNPPAHLVSRLQDEVSVIVAAQDHLMPVYIERGFTTSYLWPDDVPPGKTGIPSITYNSHGNAYWHDPGELLYSMALAYPYLDESLKASAKQYMSREMALYPPLADLPYNDSDRDWLRTGVPRESYSVPFRNDLNYWPPPAASMSTLYALWLWSKNTGDWSYAQAHWSDAAALFNARCSNMTDYYADIAGAIGYARLAQHFGYSSAYNQAVQAAVSAMQAGRNINPYIDYARNQYLDARGEPTGWYLPVFYGLTPEVGLYLSEQTNGIAQSHTLSREDGDGLRWWYLTRVGAHAEIGESSYVAPIAAWSHFLAHAYLLHDDQETLMRWLDRPWARGDLYSIQKIVATIQARPADPDYSGSFKVASSSVPKTDEVITYVISIRNRGRLVNDTIHLTDTLPPGLVYVPGSLTTTFGAPDDSDAPRLRWTGVLSLTAAATLTYRAVVAETGIRMIVNAVVIDSGSAGMLMRSGYIVANGQSVYLPVISGR